MYAAQRSLRRTQRRRQRQVRLRVRKRRRRPQPRRAAVRRPAWSLYDQIVWPLGKHYGHPYDAFKLALTEPEKVFASLTPAPSGATLAQLTATIARRLTSQPIKLRADVELTCYTEAGIDAVKRALRAGEAASTEAVPIKAKLVAPPLYVLGTNATDKYSAVERLERAIETIQSTIEGAGGKFGRQDEAKDDVGD
ncbi:eukaryotic translation initiation factor 2 alpha subunit-domain-containing protein [Phellopilus nigrolimitatus]|nr:eukaryotic translation initiation factor 2 alpha subunit-domain-containing protein [Phellopilus nigrolimitatus]